MNTDSKNEQSDSGFRVKDRRVSTQDEEVANETPPEEPKAPAEASDSPTPSRFSRFIASLHMTALYHLGLVPGPSGERPQPNLQLARENIDIMDDLVKKTAGNLSAEEDELIRHLLADARQRYLQAAIHN